MTSEKWRKYPKEKPDDGQWCVIDWKKFDEESEYAGRNAQLALFLNDAWCDMISVTPEIMDKTEEPNFWFPIPDWMPESGMREEQGH